MTDLEVGLSVIIIIQWVVIFLQDQEVRKILG